MHAETFAGIELQERDAFHHFAFGFLKDLAFFASQCAGDLVGTLPRDIRRAPENTPALGTWSFLPTLESGLRRVDGTVDVVRRGGGKFRDNIIKVGRIDVPYQPVGFRMEPLAVYVRTGLHGYLTHM